MAVFQFRSSLRSVLWNSVPLARGSFRQLRGENEVLGIGDVEIGIEVLEDVPGDRNVGKAGGAIVGAVCRRGEGRPRVGGFRRVGQRAVLVLKQRQRTRRGASWSRSRRRAFRGIPRVARRQCAASPALIGIHLALASPDRLVVQSNHFDVALRSEGSVGLRVFAGKDPGSGRRRPGFDMVCKAAARPATRRRSSTRRAPSMARRFQSAAAASSLGWKKRTIP